MALRFSLVINTYNRAESLGRTLESLRQLDYPAFEVVVVNGPSTDGTAELLRRLEGEIKIGRCPVTNLSVSRNVGIAMSAGDAVAFIDDDALPEPEWLQRLAAGYAPDEVGGVGGWVYDHTGCAFQSQYIVCDRFGDARMVVGPDPAPYFNFPAAAEYCAHLGTNSSFRRDVLQAIGGFDEEYEYYLDETDVCVRIVDAGYVVKTVPDAYVHHKFLPSHIRNEHKVVKNWYSVIKNKTYFALRNGLLIHGREAIDRNLERFVEEKRQNVAWAIRQGFLPPSEREGFERTARRAIQDGRERAARSERKLLARAEVERLARPFLPFRTILRPSAERLAVVYVSAEPRRRGASAGRDATWELAKAIASGGHVVHLVAPGAEHDTVDLEEGVWVHRIVPAPARGAGDPAPLALRAAEEVRRIDLHHRVDVVEASCQGGMAAACAADPSLGGRTLVRLPADERALSKWQRQAEMDGALWRRARFVTSGDAPSAEHVLDAWVRDRPGCVECTPEGDLQIEAALLAYRRVRRAAPGARA